MKNKNILIVTSQVAGVGDMIMAIPTFRALRENFSSARLVLVANPATVKIMAANPYFDDVLVYNRRVTLADKLSFIRQIRKMRFDMTLCLSECLSSLLLCYLSGARVKVGFNWNGRGAFLTVKVAYCKPEKKYLTELFLDLARAIGLPQETLSSNLEFWVSEEDKKIVKEFFRNKGIAEHDLKVVIHPGAGWSPRRWPAENFAQLIRLLIERHKAVVFIIGTQADKELIEKIIYMSKKQSGSGIEVNRNLFGCAGSFDLKRCAALISLSNLFVGNDSAPMHLAAAVGIPLIALFGPSSSIKYGPRTDNSIIIESPASCGPCRQLTGQDKCVRGQPECMNMITVKEVIEAVQKALDGKPMP